MKLINLVKGLNIYQKVVLAAYYSWVFAHSIP